MRKIKAKTKQDRIIELLEQILETVKSKNPINVINYPTQNDPYNICQRCGAKFYGYHAC